MKRGIAMSAAAIAGALTLLAPAVASAATESGSYTQNCPTHRVAARYDHVPVYSGWESTRVLRYIALNGQLSCTTGLYLSQTHRYSMCGISDGNGYINVILDDQPVGYTPQACWADQ